LQKKALTPPSARTGLASPEHFFCSFSAKSHGFCIFFVKDLAVSEKSATFAAQFGEIVLFLAQVSVVLLA